MSATCRLCGNGTLEPMQVPERHFGTGESFVYERCQGCGSLQIAEIPADLSRHYPQGYYSLQASWEPKFKNPLRRLAKQLRDGFELRGHGAIGRLLAARSRYPEMSSLRPLAPEKQWRILDVGCGDGFMLWSLANLGFSDLTGVDPNLAADKTFSLGFRLLKKELRDMEGSFDLLSFHHSLEHLLDPALALKDAFRILKPGGLCLVRVPTPDSEAFERYREDWIQIDAPRHLHLFSRSALKDLGEVAGLHMSKSWDDSNAFQFWGSVQAQRGVVLDSPESWSRGGRGLFSARDIYEWEGEAERLNKIGRGDSVAVLFQRPK